MKSLLIRNIQSLVTSDDLARVLEHADIYCEDGVIRRIGSALDVRADELLYDAPASGKAIGTQQIADVLSRCTPAQTQVLADILTAAKQAMDKYLD